MTIEIKIEDATNSYTFRFYGDRKYWDSSPTSEIFIAYAFDKDGKGGSEGNGGIKQFNGALKKSLISVFDEEFIAKLDNDLGIKHSE